MRSTRVRRTAPALLAVAVLALAAGCGDDAGPESASESPSESPTATPSESTSPSEAGGPPDCATVWVEGGTLEKRYRGCTQDGVTVTAEKVGCSSGQTFVLFDDTFWAVKGGLIKYSADGLAASDAYAEDMAACRG